MLKYATILNIYSICFILENYMDLNYIYNKILQSTKENLLYPTAKNIGDTIGGLTELILAAINIGTTWTNGYIRKFRQSIINNINKIPEKIRILLN